MKAIYPSRVGRKSAGFGYASDCIHIAVNEDDPEGFMLFLAECGGPEVDVLISGSIWCFAATHGAVECLKALHASGAKSHRPLEYWLDMAKKPAWGPRASRLQTGPMLAARAK